MITWGISANSHDAALAVFSNDGLEFASHAERFSGIKNDAHLNFKLIDYAKQYGEPDEVVWYERPFRKTLRQIRAGQGFNFRENNIKRYLKGYGINARIKYTGHHHSHAAAGYFTSPFTDATIVCIDSIGEFETLTVWEGNGTKLKQVYSQGYPNSVGLWYSAMTQRIGLKPNEDEYILMGMAAYGDPNRLWDDMYEMFQYVDGADIRYKDNLHRGCKYWKPELTSEQDMFDIAAATQKTYEFTLEQILEWASKNTKSKNLVLMGGCALNCSANHLTYKYFNDVWIMPNPGDAGSAIGAVLAQKKEHMPMDHAFLGFEIKGDYPVEEALSELKKTGIVGVANGRAEFGPRALATVAYLLIPGEGISKAESMTLRKDNSSDPSLPWCLQNTQAKISKDTIITICSLPPSANIHSCILPSPTWTAQVEYKLLKQTEAGLEDC